MRRRLATSRWSIVSFGRMELFTGSPPTVRCFSTTQGRAFRMVGFTADVTARKLVEEKLQRSAAFLTQAQHLSSTGSFAWRASTSDQIAWSDELYRIFDLDRTTPITLDHIRARVHPDDVKLFEKTIDEARATGSDFEFQHRLLMPDNSIKYLRVVAQATRDHDGRTGIYRGSPGRHRTPAFGRGD